MARNPKVGVSMVDPDDPYRYCSVTGEVTALTEDGAEDHIDALAGRYMNLDEYPNYDSDRGPRVVIEIEPTGVVTA